MCWQEIIGWDWAGIGAVVLWVLAIIAYLLRRVITNKKRLKRNLDKLRDGKVDMGDAEAILDLILFVLECATTLGGISGVKGILEEAVENNN